MLRPPTEDFPDHVRLLFRGNPLRKEGEKILFFLEVKNFTNVLMLPNTLLTFWRIMICDGNGTFICVTKQAWIEQNRDVFELRGGGNE